MLVYDIKTCNDCESISELLEQVDMEIYILSQRRRDNVRFDLGICIDEDKLNKLIFYKRILYKKYRNPEYLCSFSLADIVSRVKTFISSLSIRNCIFKKSTTSTTTSTTTIPATTTTSTSSSTTTTTTTAGVSTTTSTTSSTTTTTTTAAGTTTTTSTTTASPTTTTTTTSGGSTTTTTTTAPASTTTTTTAAPTTTTTTTAAPTTTTTTTTSGGSTTTTSTTTTTAFRFDAMFPITPEMMYQNNIDSLAPPDMLINGVLNETGFRQGYEYLRGLDRAAEVRIEIPTEWDATPKKIRIYNKAGGLDMNAATKWIVVRRDNQAEVEVASYMTVYDMWVEFNISAPNQHVTDQIIVRAFNLSGTGHIGSDLAWGSEWEIIGDYRPVSPPAITHFSIPLKNMFGTDGFWWDFNQSNDGSSSSVVNTDRINRMLQAGVNMLRPYITWRHIEPSEGVYAFEPTSHGWNTDLLMTTCKNNGIEPILLIMGIPPHLYTTYEGTGLISPPYDGFSHPAQYFSPVTYANRNNRETPASFDSSAKLGFVCAGRYGRNAAVPTGDMGSYYTGNILKKGLDLVNYIELLNEPDATWLGKFAHMDGAIYGAYLSAVYDGHKGTMGAGRGIKNADPTMQVVIPAYAISKTDNFRALIDWCRIHRGFDEDGNIDLPFDVINYHEYSTDGVTQYSLTTTAFPPELSKTIPTAKEYVRLSQKYCQGKEVWITEWGFDTNQFSAFGPPPISSYSIEEVVGCWSIRTMLNQLAAGLHRSVWFKTFPDNPENPIQFQSMNLLDFQNNPPIYPRKAVSDYRMQLAPYKEYVYDSTLNTDPYVMKFTNPFSGKVMYAIWAVEDTFPTTATKWILNVGYTSTPTTGFTEVTGNYNLSLPGVTSINIRNFRTGGNELTLSTFAVSGGAHNIPYGMFPTIVTLDTVESAPNALPVVSAGSDQVLTWPTNTTTLTGSASDSDGTIITTRWTKRTGPTERGRSSSSNTFNTGAKTFIIPSGMYFTAGMTNIRAYAKFDGYLLGNITAVVNNGDGTDTVSYTCTSVVLGGEAVLNATYSIWDLGEDSVIVSPNSTSTVLQKLVPGIYTYELYAEDNDLATAKDTVQITVNI